MVKKLKLLIAIASCITFIMAFSGMALADETSADVPSGWAESEISEAIELGLVTENTSYGYKNNITREEFAELAVNMFEKLTNIAVEPNENPFKDTENKEVLKAYRLGILTGKEKDIFSPDSPIRRQEIAVMLYNTLREYNPCIIAGTKREFSDNAKIAAWAAKSVDVITSNNIMFDVGNGNFDPLSYTTKEQAVALILRIYKNAETILEDTSFQSDRIAYGSVIINKDLTEMFEIDTDLFIGQQHLLAEDCIYITNYQGLFRYEFSTGEVTHIGDGIVRIISQDGNSIRCYKEYGALIDIDLTTYEETPLGQISPLVAYGDSQYYFERIGDSSDYLAQLKSDLYKIEYGNKIKVLGDVGGWGEILNIKDGWIYYTESTYQHIFADVYGSHTGVSKINIETGEIVKLSESGISSHTGLHSYNGNDRFFIDDNWIYYKDTYINFNIMYGSAQMRNDTPRLYRINTDDGGKQKLTDEDLRNGNFFESGNWIFYTEAFDPSEYTRTDCIFKINKDGSRKEIFFEGDGMIMILDVDKNYIWFYEAFAEKTNIYKMSIHKRDAELIHTISYK